MAATAASIAAAGAARAADAPVAGEYQVKAAFVCSFAHFTTWPAGAFASEDEPIRIGILGPDPFGRTIENVGAAQEFKGRRVAIERYADAAEIDTCHLLFVSPQVPLTDALMGRIARPGVMTIGESDDFTARGGVVRLYLEETKVRIEINTAAAEHAGLKISARLLSLSRLVGKIAEEVSR